MFKERTCDVPKEFLGAACLDPAQVNSSYVISELEKRNLSLPVLLKSLVEKYQLLVIQNEHANQRQQQNTSQEHSRGTSSDQVN